FIRRGTFPRTSSGKVQRWACKTALLAGTLEIVHAFSARATANQRLLQSAHRPSPALVENGKPPGLPAAVDLVHACVLRWLQGRGDAALAKLDGDTPFTSLGLDSLAAASVGLEIEKATGVRLTPDILYECQTINRLAGYLAPRRPNSCPTCAPRPGSAG